MKDMSFVVQMSLGPFSKSRPRLLSSLGNAKIDPSAWRKCSDPWVASFPMNLASRSCALVNSVFSVDHKHSKVALVSTYAFWEMDNFNPLVAHMQAICKNACWEYAGSLLRPHGNALWYMLKHDLQVHDVIEASKEAGRQIVRDGKMKEEALKTVSRELGSIDVYLEKMNADFRKALSRN